MTNIQFSALGTAVAVAPTAFIFSFQLGWVLCTTITVVTTAIAYAATRYYEKRKQVQQASDH